MISKELGFSRDSEEWNFFLAENELRESIIGELVKETPDMGIVFIAFSQYLERAHNQWPVEVNLEKFVSKFSWEEVDPKVFVPLAVPTIGISVTDPSIANKKNQITSKIGGLPDLPDNITLPTYKGNPMIFLAQIRLDEINENDVIHLLPDQGMLYFFTFIDTVNWQDPCADPDMYKVIYLDDVPANSSRPETSAMVLDEHYISFFKMFTFPGYAHPKVAHLSRHDNYTYEDMSFKLLEAYQKEYKFLHLLGEAQGCYGDTNWHWAFYVSGLTHEEFLKMDEDERINKENQYINLLQLGFESFDVGFPHYPPCGNVYFGIKKSDLEDKNFQGTVLSFR